MTSKTYIATTLSKFNLSDSEVELLMLDNGINPEEEVDVLEAKKAIHKSLSLWMPVKASVSEGGVSESWNLDAVKIYYNSLCNELGLENVMTSHLNTVRDKSNIW